MLPVLVNPRQRIRQAYRSGGIVSLTGTMLPVFLARMQLTRDIPERRRVRDAWVRTYAKAIMRMFRIDLRVTGREHARRALTETGAPRGRLVVSNHRSAIDILIMLAELGGRMVSRQDVATWPLLGPAASAVETIFVKRTDSASGVAAVRAISSALRDGDSVNIYPEGTTFEGDELRPFHGGAFVATIGTDCELLPVGLAYPRGAGAEYTQKSFGAHVLDVSRIRGTTVGVAIGAPIATSGRRARELEREVFAVVQSLVHEARALVPEAGST